MQTLRGEQPSFSPNANEAKIPHCSASKIVFRLSMTGENNGSYGFWARPSHLIDKSSLMLWGLQEKETSQINKHKLSTMLTRLRFLVG